jgi:hypothetical protein
MAITSKEGPEPSCYLPVQKTLTVGVLGKGISICFPPDIPMVHSSTLVVATDRERLTCGGFFLGETVRFGSPEFIVDYFGGLASPPGGNSGAIFIGMTRSGSPSLQTMIEDSPNEFYMTSNREGWSSLRVSRRLCMGASPTPTATT